MYKLCCRQIPIESIIGYDTNIIRQNIRILNKFRHLYYSLKFKKRFHDWLWIKVRLPKIESQYHPDNLYKLLEGDTDIDTVLNQWIQE